MIIFTDLGRKSFAIDVIPASGEVNKADIAANTIEEKHGAMKRVPFNFSAVLCGKTVSWLIVVRKTGISDTKLCLFMNISDRKLNVIFQKCNYRFSLITTESFKNISSLLGYQNSLRGTSCARNAPRSLSHIHVSLLLTDSRCFFARSTWAHTSRWAAL